MLAFVGKNQKQLSDESGIGEPQLSRYINGQKPVSQKNRQAILQALQLTTRAWGYAEHAALQLLVERERFPRYVSVDQPYPEGEAWRSDITDEPNRAPEMFDAETVDDVAAWAGGTVEALVQRIGGLFARRGP